MTRPASLTACFLVTCSALGISVWSSSPAQALPSPTPSATSTVPMNFGVDLKLAKEAGQIVRTVNGLTTVLDGSGNEIARFGKSNLTTKNTNGTIRGNCGESYIELYNKGSLQYKIQTGFYLYDGRTSWWSDWHIKGFESRGSSTVSQPDYSWSEPVGLSAGWNKTYYDSVSKSGTQVNYRVVSGKAWIVGGLYCAAGSPQASTLV